MKKKIIVVDDDPSILEVIKIMLEDLDYEVVTVSEARGVLDIIEKHKPHLVLLDLWMPGLDGQEITRRLKSKKETQNIPIVIVSALTKAEKLAQEAGADGFLAKPFEMDELIGLVGKHCTS